MTAILATRTARRRIVAFTVLLAVTLALMALSSNAYVLDLQRGVAFAFRPIQSAVEGVASSVTDLVGALTEIDTLRFENERLREDNERLRNQNARLEATKQENDQLTALLQLRSSLDFETVTARVIARESSEFRRVVTIDQGTDDGLEKGDVIVVAGGALAGRIVDVGRTFATVQLINDTESTVIGQLTSGGATGEVVGQLGGVLVMRNIDATEEVQLGDEVLTAGLELSGGVRSPYPKGLLLGQVVDVQRDANAVVQTAYLEAAADLDKLEYVLVITDYQGGIPAPDEAPTQSLNPDGTLPEGEQPYVTPGPSATP
jgi:rod shape-determining protein MreC